MCLNNRFKSSGDSDQFRFNKIPILLCDGPKHNISIISGFVNPWSPVFMDLSIPKILRKYKNEHGDIFEKMLCL